MVALAGECATVAEYQRTGFLTQAKAAGFFLILDIGFFCVSVDATSYIYGVEIFPNPLRARGLGISISGLFLTTIVFLSPASTAFWHAGLKYYLVFTLLTSLCCVYHIFLVPRGK